MKTFKLKFIWLVFGIVFLSSCTKLLYTSVDVLRPAKVAFDTSVKNLLIVNNAPVQPIDYGHTTNLLNDKTKNAYIITDSLSIFCVGALTEELDNKNFFSSVQLIPGSKNNDNNFYITTTLNNETVKQFCKDNHVEAILSLDKIKVNDDLSEYYLNETGNFLSTLEVKIDTYWSLHYPGNSEPKALNFKDTIYWESESYNRKAAIGELPKRSDALIDGALYTGKKSIDRFVPFWQKEDRYFFDPSNKYMKRGMDSIYVKNWPAAITYWKKALQKTQNSWTKVQANNNIAIAYEIIGDIDQALEYATQAYYLISVQYLVDYKTYNRLSDYLTILSDRKTDIAKLKKQLGE